MSDAAAPSAAAGIAHPTLQTIKRVVDGVEKTETWFQEINDLWPGQAMGLRVDEVLYHNGKCFDAESKSLQDVLVFKSTDYGNVLVLDNVIQVTTRDEFAYQEMIAHLGLFSHPDPKKVLVIGGGDGGVLREIAKHEGVETIEICEIDKEVIDASEKYLPTLYTGYSDKRVTVHIKDGVEFLKNKTNEYDVIITDSSDPVGPAEVLYQEEYYHILSNALRDGGVITTQGSENQWLHFDFIKKLTETCHKIFPTVEYAYTSIPTYPSGQIGFMVCCKDANRNLRVPVRSLTGEQEDSLFQYYSKEMHSASFVVPTFAEKMLRAARPQKFAAAATEGVAAAAPEEPAATTDKAAEKTEKTEKAESAIRRALKRLSIVR